MTVASMMFVETARDRSPLVARLASALSPDAQKLARRISMDLLAATNQTREHESHVLFLLCMDALNHTRSEASRAIRWRRFIRTLATFLETTASQPLAELVRENADLLH